MPDNRILVTGASGFIGKATVKALEASGYLVTQAGRRDKFDLAENHTSIDLADCFSLKILEEKGPFDGIVHLGARIGLTDFTEADLYIPNVVSTGILAKFARDWNAHFIFASTAIIHGVRTQQISEDSPVLLDTTYAKSKWLAEELIRMATPSYTILRIGGVYGLDGPSHLGINKAIDNCINGVVPQLMGQGKALRNYIYVDDVAHKICSILASRIQGLHLMAGTEIISVREMLEIITNRFMPGSFLQTSAGNEASDQIITHSPFLKGTRSFRESVDHMFHLSQHDK
jgi:nucleoside-diphosphate-sugar epimerase